MAQNQRFESTKIAAISAVNITNFHKCSIMQITTFNFYPVLDFDEINVFYIF